MNCLKINLFTKQHNLSLLSDISSSETSSNCLHILLAAAKFDSLSLLFARSVKTLVVSGKLDSSVDTIDEVYIKQSIVNIFKFYCCFFLYKLHLLIV